MPPVPNRTALTTREETMNGIWRSPKLKPKWKFSRGRKLLPARRTLFQIDVLGERSDRWRSAPGQLQLGIISRLSPSAFKLPMSHELHLLPLPTQNRFCRQRETMAGRLA